MPYIPHTEADRKAMLDIIGVETIDELFSEIPEELKLKGELNIPSALDEQQLADHLLNLSLKNVDLSKVTCYLGAGIYDRFIPSTVGAVISRGEFLTAYTPYQPEASQGYLQTIYEFQSMVAELYGMDLANASMYDGATSLAEAAIMATAIKNRDVIYYSEAIHPHFKQVLETFCAPLKLDLRQLPVENGLTNLDGISESACILVQYPNFFGSIEDLSAVRQACDKADAMMIVSADPIACAILPPPGEFGADIVVGEGQPMGVPMGFGGPLLGLFACKEDYVRSIPGRIVGKTVDGEGRLGYTMTLRTREQDIRRERATSNICTNEALMALASTVYMISLGKNGMRQIAESSVRNTQYAIQKLQEAGAKLVHTSPVFCEFVLDLGKDAKEVQKALLEQSILAGLPLGTYWPEMKDHLLVCVTEKRTKDEIDAFASALAKAIG